MRAGSDGAGREGTYVAGKWVPFRRDLSLEARISAWAQRQHWVLTLPQLQFAGLTASAVRKRIAAGRLHRIHRGVYAIGRNELSARGRWMAATLACGPRAVLSHRSSAVVRGIHGSEGAKTHVTLPSSCARTRPGIEVHTSTTLTAADIARVDGIPCTSLARTLVDFADTAKRREVERAVDRAEILRLFDLPAVEAAIARAGRRRGAALLRAVLADYAGPQLTEEGVEERFFTLCRSAGLPDPEANVWITLAEGDAYKTDFLWREERLIVETDGRDAHTTRAAFERDRLRDQRLTLAGFTMVRFTWRQVTREPDRVLRTTQDLLARLARP